MKKIGIIFAMEEELKELLSYLNITKEYNIFDLKFYEGTIHNIECILVKSGVGKVNAARTTQILIDNIKVDYIFNIGVAGGISNILNVGDIVIGECLVQHDFDITAFDHEKGYIPEIGVYIKSDEYLYTIANNVLRENNEINVLSGVIASGDIFCTELSMSQKINQKFNALCVEMEGASIAQICHLCHIPFLVLRSISDTPNNNNVITYEQFLEKSSKNIAEAMYKILNKLNNDQI